MPVAVARGPVAHPETYNAPDPASNQVGKGDHAPVAAELLARARNAAATRAKATPVTVPDKGDVCGTIPRRDGSDLVVAVKEFEGRPFVSVGLWSGGWPVKGRSVSVRLSELGQVLEALVAAAEKAGAR